MENFRYPIDLTHQVKVEVDAASTTIEGGRYKPRNGHASFAEVSEVFVSDTGGGSARSRTLALLLKDGRTVGFAVSLPRASVGTQGAPTVDHEAAMTGFHAAAASILRSVALARPDLQVELGPTPAERKQLKIIGGCGLAALLVVLLLFRPIDLANYATTIPYLGWAVVGVIYGWSNWKSKPTHVAIGELASLIAQQPHKLAV